jgi:phytanoyl-CoA hydroxylase
MKNNNLSKFENDGFLLQKNLFSKADLLSFEIEFNKILYQLNNSNENINARWGSPLTNDLEDKNSCVIHTHNVHSFSAKMLEMIQQKRFLDHVESLMGPDIMLHHTKLFYKPPLIGSAFPLHQDWSYFPSEKNTMIAAVIHLTDTSSEMGCIRLIPKSHKFGQIKKSNGHKHIDQIHSKYTLEKALPITAKAGDVLFFHSCTIHGSLPNQDLKPRKTILIQLYSGKDKIIKKRISRKAIILFWH